MKERMFNFVQSEEFVGSFQFDILAKIHRLIYSYVYTMVCDLLSLKMSFFSCLSILSKKHWNISCLLLYLPFG